MRSKRKRSKKVTPAPEEAAAPAPTEAAIPEGPGEPMNERWTCPGCGMSWYVEKAAQPYYARKSHINRHEHARPNYDASHARHTDAR